MELSVIVCTNNPRPDYLQRVLSALKEQTHPSEWWELLLVDNASDTPLVQSWDLSWHPCSRHIREDELGLTPARLRGIKESTGHVLVFVDDDNVLAPDYLSIAAGMALQWPMLGAWAGEALPEFETDPAEALRPYIYMMASSPRDDELGIDVWSNIRGSAALPSGAGMCIRRQVAEAYLVLAANDERRRRLDRCGQSLVSGGDTDMAFTACDMGFGTGVFHKLKLTHLIAGRRVTLSYLLLLREAMSFSEIVLESFRNANAGRLSLGRCAIDYVRAWTSRGIQGQFSRASLRGRAAARKLIKRSGNA